MSFDATPINVLILLLIGMAVYTLYALFRRKLDSNVPLLFFVAVMGFMSWSGRELNSALFLCGLFGALVLRFEFMNRKFMNVILTVEVLAVAGIAFRFLNEIFTLRF